MKSKLILSLLGLSLGVAATWGTDSYNVNVAPGTGYTLAADQLALDPNDLSNTPMGYMLSPKAQFITWDVTSQSFLLSTRTVVQPSWNPSPLITVGEGFYCNNPNGATPGPLVVPFTGLASTTPTPITGFSPTTLWYLVGSQTYDSTPGATYNYYDITGYSTPVAGMSLYRSKNAVPGGNLVYSIPPTDPTDWIEYWYDGTWHPSDPEINLGEAVWIGPSLCSIEGTVTDNNGKPLPNWEMSLSDGRYTFTDANGKYRFGVSASGEYTVSQIPPCGWTTLTDPQSATVNCPGAVVQLLPFRAILNGINTGPDLAVILNYVPDPGNPAYPCPNDTGYYSVRYYNKCGATVPAGSTLEVVLSSYVTYGNAGNPAWAQTPPVGGGLAGGFSISGNTLDWTLGPLPAGAIGEIRIPIQVTGPIKTSKVFTQLATTATIYPVATDAYPSDNYYSLQTLARCSFDPNDKAVEPPGCGPTGLINGNQLLTYTVQFQNVGSAPALDVVVTDELDPSLDPSTLKIVGASHQYVFQLSGNQMTWTFPNINLPDETEDPQGSHGFVIYQVQPLPGLAEGTVITNMASIVFDKNPPVLTAITTNTITSATMPVSSFTVSPRPGSAGHTNDFTYTGGTVGATFYWDFGPDAIPTTSTDMNPSGVVFPTDGLRTINLQVFSGDCTGTPASYLLSVGQPVLNIASSSSNRVELSWLGDTYSLQEADTLRAPIPWLSLSLPLMQVGATHFTALGVTNVVRFYRLTDQP